MTTRGDSWPFWVVGLLLGAMVGVPVGSFGMPALVMGTAIAGVGFMAARCLAFVSGVITGVGGTWLALLGRAQLACDAFDAAPNQSCKGSGTEPWLALSVLVLGFGLVLGGIAWQRQAARRRSISR